MALTGPQQEKIRFYCGWSDRFHSFDTRLEQAMAAVDVLPDTEARITNGLSDDPPGLLAELDSVWKQLKDQTKRLKASRVGSIALNGMELYQLRSEGRRMASALCSVLGVEKRQDVFGTSAPQTFQGFGGPEGSGGNFVGK